MNAVLVTERLIDVTETVVPVKARVVHVAEAS